MDVGLHDDGVERPVDAALGLEDGAQEAPTTELGNGQVRLAGLGGEHSRAVPVGLGRALCGQLLADRADGFSDQIEPFARLEGGEQLGQDILSRPISVSSFGAFGQQHAPLDPLMGGPQDPLQPYRFGGHCPVSPGERPAAPDPEIYTAMVPRKEGVVLRRLPGPRQDLLC